MQAATIVGRAGDIKSSFRLRKTALKRLVRVQKGGSNDECQQNINKQIDDGDEGWIQLSQLLQNIKGKGIATIIGKIKTQEVIVKVQIHNRAQREFEIQRKLHEKNLEGFIQFACIFQCGNDISYVDGFGQKTLNRQQSICSKKGDSLGVILMPYYKMGSYESYLQDKTAKRYTHETAIQILSRVVRHVFDAFAQHRFTHGDLFAKNIILDDDLNPIIIDFENSNFNDAIDTRIFWRDLHGLLPEVGNYLDRKFYIPLSDICQEHVVKPLAYNRMPNTALRDALLDALRSLAN